MLLPVCVESEQYPLIRASLDGLRDCSEPVELKCPSATVWQEVCLEKANSNAYRLYYPQSATSALGNGSKKARLVSLLL